MKQSGIGGKRIPLEVNIGDVFGVLTVIGEPFTTRKGNYSKRRVLCKRIIDGVEIPVVVSDLENYSNRAKTLHKFGDKFLKNRFEVRGDTTVLFLRRKIKKLPDMECFIDTEDLGLIADSQVCFVAVWSRSSKTYYASWYPPYPAPGIVPKNVNLHRLVMGLPPMDLDIDHQDHNGLNDRKYNLSACTRSQNMLNRKGATKSSSSGIRDVYRTKTGRWLASIKVDKKPRGLGTFDTAEEAEAVVNLALSTGNIPDHKPAKRDGGVQLRKGRWIARKTHKGKRGFIGSFDSQTEALEALQSWKP